MITALLTGLGCALVIEGLVYALVPGQLKRLLAAMQQLSDDQLRLGGVVSLAAGVAFIWLVRSLSG